MASFLINKTFSIPLDAQGLRSLSPGAVYIEGDTITGLRAAEARELLSVAPEGALTAQDEEAEVVTNHFIQASGSVRASGESEAKS